MSFGLLVIMYELASSSLAGDLFSLADESIERTLMQTELVFKAGVQSVLNVERQMYPQE